ncbi:cytochrome c oxidase subunit 2A [Paenibacillus nanensis]|uniref:cytochrome c oxidase subunit 2A n=1 Tax=Paenibacillus nanensis TaxID=393251 RepID=UPI0019823300|nr:cytochrome c oxidase subunit 2A [Paenibacillus nanensis]
MNYHNKDEAPKDTDTVTRQEETSLKGTFVSVMLLGAFILVTWALVFVLYIERQ